MWLTIEHRHYEAVSAKPMLQHLLSWVAETRESRILGDQ